MVVVEQVAFRVPQRQKNFSWQNREFLIIFKYWRNTQNLLYVRIFFLIDELTIQPYLFHLPFHANWLTFFWNYHLATFLPTT